MKMNNIFSKMFLLLFFIHTSLFSQDQDIINVNEAIEKQDYAQSFTLLEQMILKNPNNSNIYRLYATLLLNLENYNEALSNINKALLLSQEDNNNYRVAGNIYRAMKDYTNASTSYAKAIALQPKNAENYHEYAILNIQFGYLIDASRLLELGASFDSKSWQNPLIKAKIALQKNQLADAKRILIEAINIFPNKEELIIELANIYIKTKQPNQAIALLKEAMVRFSESPKKNMLIADILFEHKNYQEALNYYLASQKSTPAYLQKNRTQLLWKLFNLYYLTGNPDPAEENISNALMLDKNHQLYQAGYYYFLFNTKDSSYLPRKKAGNLLLELAFNKKNSGLSLYYVSLLQKAGLLDPLNVIAKDQLLEYAKLKKDCYLINNILQEIAQVQTTTSKIHNVILFRNHLTSTKRLSIDKGVTYQFKHLIYIEPRYDLLHKILASEIQNVEQFYPNIRSTIETEKSFLQHSAYIFQSNQEYNLISSISFDTCSNMNIVTYDPKGMPITNTRMPLSEKTFTEHVLFYAKWINNLVPNIGSIKKRLGGSAFEISLGSTHGLSNKTKLSVLDHTFKPISEITITNITAFGSIGYLSGKIPNTDLVNQYVIQHNIIDPSNKQYFDITRLHISNQNQ
ncbi:MAG: tetratricopeptide repeat protein [Brevinema sp.]